MTDDNKKKSAGDHVEDLGVDWPDLTQESEAIAEAMQTAAIVQKIGQTMFHSFSATREELQAVFNSEEWQRAVEALKTLVESLPAWIRIIPDINEIAPYLSEELQKPEYEGKTLDDLFYEAEQDEEGHTAESSLFMQALSKARESKKTIDAQNEGRKKRKELRKKALERGAIMKLNKGKLPVFSESVLWNAFAPDRIARIGKLPPDKIDEETGMVFPDSEDIEPLKAHDISFKSFMLLNAIMANTVSNYFEEFVLDGSITFYVKGVLDSINVDARIKDDMQLNVDRKTAGVLYLEKRFEPLLLLIGTLDNGSRYSVLNYHGYDAESDTITIRSPYLFQLWLYTQDRYFDRQDRKNQRISEGKKPFKDDLTPLEVNALFKGEAYKEDNTVLEIAVYITNVMLKAGKGNKKTEILYKTLIKNCPRLNEKLNEIENLPKTEIIDGKERKINKTARYNTELRKIARAYKLIMDLSKCEARKYYDFEVFMPTKGQGDKKGEEMDFEKREFILPTKSMIDGKIIIKWKTNKENPE